MVDDECGAISGMINKENRSARRKPVPFPLRSPQIPLNLIWARTRTVEVGSKRLTA
jgi:hypothetical protein